MAAYATLFSAQTANGSSAAREWTKGETITVHAWGTFGTGTLVIEGSHDGVVWTALAGMSFTAAGIKSATLPMGSQVRATLSGVDVTTNINAVIM